MGVTIKQVAVAAGVSPATVSNVINGTRYVSTELRERVLRAMDELRYEPNALARSLRSQQTCTIGVIVPDISNPFHGTLAIAIEAKAVEAGYTVMLCLSHYDLDLEYSHVRTLTSKQVDGIIITFSAESMSTVKYAQRRGVPVVVADWLVDDKSFDSVTANNRKGGYLAAQHLLALGHRHIAYITGPLDSMPTRERLAGFYDAMVEAGIDVPKEWIFHYPQYGFVEARESVRRLLDMNRLPTAICFGNDYMALGGLSALLEARLKVPRDVSVVGFDDIWVSSLSNPTLTTVRQPITKIGEEAFSLLLERMTTDETSPGETVILDVELVKRNSTRPPRK